MTWHPDHDPTVDLRDDEAVRAAVEDRTAGRALTRMSAESATLAGTLRDLAERQIGTTVLVTGGHSLQGSLVGVAADHVVLATQAHQFTHVRTDHIVSVRADPEVTIPVAQGDRAADDRLTLLQRLDRWEEDRPVVACLVRGRPDPLRGRLLAVGEDVISLDIADDRHPSYVAESALLAVMVDHR